MQQISGQRLAVLLFLIFVAVLVMNVAPPPWIRYIAWRLPRHPDREYGRRSISDIRGVVIHHTAGPEDQRPEDIARYHSGSNHICDAGCPGIGYHYMIDRRANVYQVNDLTTVSYHSGDQNGQTVGICLIGNYNEIEPTKAQLNKIKRLIRYLNRKTGRTLFVSGHRDHTNTSCPGANVQIGELENAI